MRHLECPSSKLQHDAETAAWFPHSSESSLCMLCNAGKSELALAKTSTAVSTVEWPLHMTHVDEWKHQHQPVYVLTDITLAFRNTRLSKTCKLLGHAMHLTGIVQDVSSKDDVSLNVTLVFPLHLHSTHLLHHHATIIIIYFVLQEQA